MNKEIRSALQRATQAARRLLEREYAEQLEGVYDILSDGTIAPQPGAHLDQTQRLLREKIIAAIMHKKAGGEKLQDAVGDYLRETSFTTLNRFVALKMLEARKLVQQCISQGDQSSGFREFTGLAPGMATFSDKGYRLYLESLFDEIAREVKVLFDRRDVASLLWPRRQAFTSLLEILNDAALISVWGADETIGWVYQYFNGDDERRQMRESQAPQNSRELAVRNQFFTPRYIVEFLIDNTLGRIWYEMMHGQTMIVKSCSYLVHRSTEIFLEKEEEAPVREKEADFSQEELFNQPVYIPLRPKKDPRDLKVLDPAGGSGHFLLYGFDLLLIIYEEAWNDTLSAISESTGMTLRQDYPNLEKLRLAVPGLILRYNLHGIDIDPRAAQIASLALWMRAQRAYNDFDIPREQRPIIKKTNFVVAEPMPGEQELLKEFVEGLNPKVLGQLVEIVFEKMKLAGEAGSLLKIEMEIDEAISEAKQIWQREYQQVIDKRGNRMLFSEREMGGNEAQQTALFDVSDITGDEFWDKAETRLIDALHTYAKSASIGSGFKRQLFVEDTERGFAFLDLCRKKFDVAVMNPPFGEPTLNSKGYLKNKYDLGRPDLYMCFYFRMNNILNYNGKLGIISSRTFQNQEFFQKMRESLLSKESPLEILVDLGKGVLDDATVETSAYVSSKNSIVENIIFLSAETVDDKNNIIVKQISDLNSSIFNLNTYLRKRISLLSLPGGVFTYWITDELAQLFTTFPSLDANCAIKPVNSSVSISDYNGKVRQGLIPGDLNRFARVRWEVPFASIGKQKTWVTMMKGGDFSRYYSDDSWVLLWKNNGYEIKAFAEQRYGGASRTIKNEKEFFKKGFTYPRVSSVGLNVRSMTDDCLFSDTGMAVIPRNNEDFPAILGFLNSRVADILCQVLHPGRKFEIGHVAALPIALDAMNANNIGDIVEEIHNEVIKAKSTEISHSNYIPILFKLNKYDTIFDLHIDIQLSFVEIWLKITELQKNIDEKIIISYGLSNSSKKFLYNKILDGRNNQKFNAEIDCTLLPEIVTKEKLFIQSPDVMHCMYKIITDCFGLLFGNIEYKILFNLKDILSSYFIMVDDEGHESDIINNIFLIFDNINQCHGKSMFYEAQGIFEKNNCDMRTWIRKSFFDLHLKEFTRSSRKAPIYWCLSTQSKSYAVWIYYHNFGKDTFYKIFNDYVSPKLQSEERKLAALRVDFGRIPTTAQRKQIEEQEKFVEELKAFREEVAIVAPLWNPNLHDGVIINFSLLWRLVPQISSWQKECKQTWDELVKGDYDWSHLAMHLWPERVVLKCHKDRSFAIAHGLESTLWEQGKDEKFQPRKVTSVELELLISQRSSRTVKDSLEKLLSAPVAFVGGRKRKRA